MKFERAHLWNRDGKIEASAFVEVPGLGMVEFQHALSDELCKMVVDESIAALRVKFGQKLNEGSDEQNR